MNPRIRRIAAAASIALGAAALAPATFAQTQPPTQAQQQPTQAQAPAQNAQATPAPADAGPAPTDTELQQFAQAARDVETIKQTAQPEMAKAKTPDARTQIQQSAEKKMEAAVRSHSLSIQRYQQIAMVAQTDSNVRAKLMKLLQAPPASS